MKKLNENSLFANFFAIDSHKNRVIFTEDVEVAVHSKRCRAIGNHIDLKPIWQITVHLAYSWSFDMLSVSTLSSRLAWMWNDNTIKEYQNIEISKSRKRSRIRENIRKQVSVCLVALLAQIDQQQATDKQDC
jgi:hypothetical protein